MAVTFDENTDYQALINEAAAKKDYKAAAKYEQQRNAKIEHLDATGTNKWNATATNNYAGWLDDAPKYTAPAVTDYSSYIEEMNRAKTAAALANINAAYEKNEAAIARAGVGLEESYQNARNQTAGASELAKRNNAEYAAAYGLNSGTGGQMELARNVTLQNNLNSINTAEGQSMADLALQRANAETEYNNAIAQANAQGNSELASALYQEKVRVQEALLNQQIQQYQTEYQAYRDSVGDNQWQQTYDQNMAQQNWQNLYNQTAYDDSQTAQKQSDLANAGWSFLKVGALPSAEMLSAMGMTAADADSYIAAMKAASSTPTASNMTLATAKDLASNGIVTEQSLKVLNDGGYNNDSIKSIYGIDVGSVVSPPATSAPAYNNGSLRSDQVKELQQFYGLTADGFWGPNSQSTTGMSADEAWAEYQKSKTSNTYTGNFSSVYEALATGHPEKAVTRVDEIWNTLSPAQRTELQNILKKYGYEYTP